MANEFRIKHGLIVTGSSYFSESMFGPNLPTETNPQYFMTWRQSDGRFEVTPASGIASKTLTQACWNYDGYATTPGTGEFSIRASGTNRLDSNTTTIWLDQTDNNSVNQSTLLNSIGSNSVVTFYINNQIIKYTVTGVTKLTTSNTYTLGVSHDSGDSGVFNIGDEVCMDLTVSSSGGSALSANCLSLSMGGSVSDIPNTTGEAIFNRINPVGGSNWNTPFGTVDNTISMIYMNDTDLSNKKAFNFFTGFAGNISISYSNPITGTSHNTVFTYSGFGSAGTAAQIYVTYKSGNTGYTIPNHDSFTLCKI